METVPLSKLIFGPRIVQSLWNATEAFSSNDTSFPAAHAAVEKPEGMVDQWFLVGGNVASPTVSNLTFWPLANLEESDQKAMPGLKNEGA